MCGLESLLPCRLLELYGQPLCWLTDRPIVPRDALRAKCIVSYQTTRALLICLARLTIKAYQLIIQDAVRLRFKAAHNCQNRFKIAASLLYKYIYIYIYVCIYTYQIRLWLLKHNTKRPMQFC